MSTPSAKSTETTTTSGFAVPDLLRMRVSEDADRTVMRVDGAATMTYAGWNARSDALAHGLLDTGAARGDVVALLFGGMDWVDYAVAYMGILKAGCTAIHLNDTMPKAEITRRLAQCRPSGMIRGSGIAPPDDPGCWVRTVSALETGEQSPVDVRVGPEDISDLLYSSGTTGDSKPVRVPHGNLTFGRGPEAFAQFGDPRPLIVPMQLGTTASVTTTNVALSLRATLIATRPGDVERMGELIAEHGVGSVMVNPMIAARMVAAKIHERYDLSSVHTLASAAAAIAPALADRLLAMFPGARLNSSYTEVEAVPGVVVNTYDPARPLSVGRPTPSTEVRVVDEQDVPVPDGDLGRIQLRCAAPRRRYLHNQQPPGDDWTRTGDLGYIGDDGDLYLFDRAEDAIHTPTEILSTIALEAEVYEHPAVLEAAVFGVPDGSGGQRVAAAVVLAPDSTLDDLNTFLERRLPPHWVPRQIELLPELPFSPNGKVRKRVLRDRLRETAARPDQP
ncbi:class I adenylate-forming enzyme family protein [Streptomyces canus]|uniref:class I adenylate-forming enzyme family protein n=1 Tax=Streptomyces canus TaxID=58343 RepID=UPI0027D8E608|nr:class I adenylate-forming enzyme family protein [Streptomyces canus]